MLTTSCTRCLKRLVCLSLPLSLFLLSLSLLSLSLPLHLPLFLTLPLSPLCLSPLSSRCRRYIYLSHTLSPSLSLISNTPFSHILHQLGLPPGVINFLPSTAGRPVSDPCFEHPDLAGLHFTGSTGAFQSMWKTIGNNIHKYKSFPRIVGETGSYSLSPSLSPSLSLSLFLLSLSFYLPSLFPSLSPLSLSLSPSLYLTRPRPTLRSTLLIPSRSIPQVERTSTLSTPPPRIILIQLSTTLSVLRSSSRDRSVVLAPVLTSLNLCGLRFVKVLRQRELS